MATINLGRIKPVNKGTWSNSTAYAIDDFVQYTDNGVLSTYIAVATSTNQTPSTSGTVNSTYWKFMAKGVASELSGIGNNKIVVTNSSGNATGLTIGTAGQALKVNSGANGFEFGAIDDTYGTKLFHCTEGTFATNTTNSWTKLGLTTVKTNEVSGASLSNGVMTIPAGTYISQSFSMYYRVNGYNARLRNTTDGADLIMGSGGHSWSSPNDASSCPSFMVGKFTISAQKNVELQYYIETSNNQSTLQSGHPNQVMLWKVA